MKGGFSPREYFKISVLEDSMKFLVAHKGVLLVALAASIFAVFFVLSSAQMNFLEEEWGLHPTGSLPALSSTISAASTTIAVELAVTSLERAKGLSGRRALDADKGMLFIFDYADKHGFWMPDMHFPIDIIWIDTNWRIVDIAANVSPDSYPRTFTPKEPALYVLEVVAGLAERSGWVLGSQFTTVLYKKVDPHD